MTSKSLDRSTTPWKTRLSSWLRAPIDTDQHLLEYELMALTLSTGIIDAVSFPKFHCFASNQTGNTVFFAISTFSLVGTRQQTDFSLPVPHIAVSLAFFCLGAFATGQFANIYRCKSSRWWMLVTNAMGSIMFFIASILNFTNRTGNYLATAREQNSATILCSIGLLAFASGAQVSMSRQLGMPEIPTTQATAAYVDLFADPDFFVPIMDRRGRSRNRRIVFIVTLVIGSFIGAPAYHYVNTAFTILLSAIIKTLVTIAFSMNRAKRGPREYSI